MRVERIRSRFRLSGAILLVLSLNLNLAFAAAADDKDLQILQLRKALAAEKIERLRLEYLITKQTHDQISAELAEKQKEVKPDEKK